ncbi:MAG: hypothetical protein WCI27_07645 [Candidatus Omnitrophota bacterium]
MTSRTGNSRAVTIIEVMVTVIILTVGIVGIIQAYIKSLDVLRISKDMLTEVSLAENKLAELRRLELMDNGLAPASTKGSFTGNDGRFNWELDIRPSDIAGLNTVNVKCSAGYSRRAQEFILTSYAKNK